MPLITDKSRKWFLAICMSLIMISMILPSYFGQGSHGARDEVQATVFANEGIKYRELEHAKEEWRLLAGTAAGPEGQLSIATQVMMGDMGQYGRDMGLLQAAYQLAQQTVSQISAEPSTFAILKREAMKAGVTVNQQRVDQLAQEMFGLAPEDKSDRADSYRSALASLVLVDTHARQSAGAAKVTRPELRSNMARVLQSLRLGVAIIDAKDFNATSVATDETARTVFESFKARPAGDAAYDTNPFGFGYRQGDRVRLDYIALPRAEMLRVARETLPAYDWEVEAQKYYVKNQAQYMSVEAPTSRPADPLSLGSGGDSGKKTLKPFPAVKDEILDTLYNARADQLTVQVQRRLTSLLSADYRAYADAIARKAAAPVTSVGKALESFDYLTAIAARVEQDTKVRPTVTTFSDRYLDDAELAATPGIGTATPQQTAGSSARQVPLPKYLLALAKPFFETSGAARQPGTVAIEFFEPVIPFVGEDQTIYLTRITAGEPNRVPAFSEVEARVKQDVVTAVAQEQAVAAAKILQESDRSFTIVELAARTNRKFVIIPELSSIAELPPELDLSPVSKQVFLEEAFNLLREDPSLERPRIVVNLPRDKKVMVVELLAVKSLVPGEDLASIEAQALHRFRLQHQNDFLFRFYQRDAVVTRTSFVSKVAPAKPAGTTTSPS